MRTISSGVRSKRLPPSDGTGFDRDPGSLGLVGALEVSPRATLAHPPHGGGIGGERLVSRPRIVRREAVVSLDTGRAPAMLLRCGSLIG
jgi:hypothetical protein